ncbi:methylenetetrahydrofolate reductase [Desulfosarcina cetonica]|uniref:methylenetetrahydrofolate reductase n=1 Tax=Desulfosarcina cetonica TaxID=90730 RepID=UPI0006CFF491|nr:methylenetetrahydrofolate reductase [Desulfosarcina cetonica]
MLRVFQNDILDPEQFVVTLELVPGRESTGRAVDTVMGIARDAFNDGRISAVSITDNPGGNPSLSPDAIGYRIFSIGMDVIVHFTCRDMNRVGMESRALQLAMMGMKNILALTGDYAGKGFGGQGAPVFDLDSVNLQIMLMMIGQRINAAGDPDAFFTGCAVSPFKKTEGECVAQYAKMSRKIAAGAQFVITQLGYDARKFMELIQIQRHMDLAVPTWDRCTCSPPGRPS